MKLNYADIKIRKFTQPIINHKGKDHNKLFSRVVKRCMTLYFNKKCNIIKIISSRLIKFNMYKFNLLTNENVILLGLVDNLSDWDYFITDCQYDIFEQLFGKNTEDKIELKKYARKRRKLGWQYEIDLLTWAFKGFKKHTKFSILLPHLKYFRNRINLQNELTVKKFLEDRVYENNQIIKKIETEIHSILTEQITEKIMLLFESQITNKTLPIYFTTSLRENSLQGGANGAGISIQVPPNSLATKNIALIRNTIIHEILHKLIDGKKYYKVFQIANKEDFFNQIYPNIYPNEIKGFFSEVIVHTLSECIFSNEDISLKLKHYKEQNNPKLGSMIQIYKCIPKVEKIIKEYITCNQPIETTRALLANSIINLVSNFEQTKER